MARRRRLGLKDLAEQTVVLPEDDPFTQRIVHQKTRMAWIALRRILKTTTFPVLTEAVLHGLVIRPVLKSSMLPSHKLVSVPITSMPEAYRHTVITPRDKGDLRLIQSLVA